MSKLSKLLDRVSGRRRADAPTEDNAPGAGSPHVGGEPYPNAQTTGTHDPGGAKA